MIATLAELSEICGARLEGNADCEIVAVNTLSKAMKGEITFLSNRHYVHQLPETNASAVILAEEDFNSCPTNSLVSSNPYLAYAKVANYLYPHDVHAGNIDSNAIIAESSIIDDSCCISANVVIGNNVKVAAGVYIGPGCVIEENVEIGKNSSLLANVTLRKGVVLGENVTLHPGVVIGADGFGMAQENGKWLNIPQIGSVRIGNNVDVGANSTIDRGAIEDTIISDGVRIDNQVQIGHNVFIGEDTAIAGCAAVAGSTVIGKRCMIAGAVGISGHIEIVDDVIVTAMSGVANSIKTAGVYSSGLPVTDNKTWRRNIIRFKKLDEILKKLTR
ncbi:MAG: UDP-3-O-(3-hydroxymyristoyl)glucosamine N-acyltransferase [Gammaproteobacteria bacterium]|jgi:UDP-3-O-[3-hydroxymyristoyl] glucosamine N-acyltransferase